MNTRATPTRRRLSGLLLAIAAAGILAGCQAVDLPATGASTTAQGQSRFDHGVLPEGADAFDEHLPGIAGLNAELKAALQQATQDARAEGVEITVNSGWRSKDLQTQLFESAVDEYGSERVAAQWVATAETSEHVSGDAVDIGGMDAYLWLGEPLRGQTYGLCQIYANEPWHFELVPSAVAEGCPEMYPDPTHDPRMQR